MRVVWTLFIVASLHRRVLNLSVRNVTAPPDAGQISVFTHFQRTSCTWCAHIYIFHFSEFPYFSRPTGRENLSTHSQNICRKIGFVHEESTSSAAASILPRRRIPSAMRMMSTFLNDGGRVVSPARLTKSSTDVVALIISKLTRSSDSKALKDYVASKGERIFVSLRRERVLKRERRLVIQIIMEAIGEVKILTKLHTQPTSHHFLECGKLNNIVRQSPKEIVAPHNLSPLKSFISDFQECNDVARDII